MIRLLLAMSLMLSAMCIHAKDSVVRLQGIKFKADNEAPQVMHIIPWQNPEGAERLYSPVRGAEIERLKPIDPYSFELETALHEQWQANQSQPIDLVNE